MYFHMFFFSQYHLMRLAFVSQVFKISANNPKDKIKNICLNESGMPEVRKKMGDTAIKAVAVIKIPVLNALKIRVFTATSRLLRAREVNKISVSTE